jgi:hypothetical protein
MQIGGIQRVPRYFSNSPFERPVALENPLALARALITYHQSSFRLPDATTRPPTRLLWYNSYSRACPDADFHPALLPPCFALPPTILIQYSFAAASSVPDAAATSQSAMCVPAWVLL